MAYIFPGQGSQYPGMGKDLAEKFPAARQIFEEADEALRFLDFATCVLRARPKSLQLTENTQPAILTVSVAALRAMESEGFPKPDFVAGHSLGEYSALVAARSLVVDRRSANRSRARPLHAGGCARRAPARWRRFSARDLKTIEAACGEASAGPGLRAGEHQFAEPDRDCRATPRRSIARSKLLKARGAKRVVKLNVSAPFHCALMMPAQERLAADLEELEFDDLSDAAGYER